MADLSDDVGESLSQEMRNIARDWLRDMLRRFLSGDEKQRQLGLRLQRWSYDCPQDPYQAIKVNDLRKRASFVKRLEDEGYDVKTYHNFVCVLRSQLEQIMVLAVEMGVKDEVKEPLGRLSLTLDCQSASVARDVIDDLRAAGIECYASKTNPHKIQCNVFESQLPTVQTIALEHGVEISDALKERAEKARTGEREPDERESSENETRDVSEQGDQEEGKDGDEEPDVPEETSFVDSVLDSQSPEEELLSRPATERQMEVIDRLTKEGIIPEEERAALGSEPTLAQAHELLDRYYTPLQRDNLSPSEPSRGNSRDEVAPPTETADSPEQAHQREAGTKEVATDDRFVEVGMSDRTDYVSSNGQDVVEEHDAEDDRDAARERAAQRGAQPISQEEAERENEDLVTRNESLIETKERLDRADSLMESMDLERNRIPVSPER